MPDPSQEINRTAFLKVATYFESSLVIIAYLIGWLTDLNPLANLSLTTEAVFWGLTGTVPLYGFFLCAYRLPVSELQGIKRLLIDRLGPVLNTCHWRQLLYLGLLAGTTEEILFRGLLQPLLEAHGGRIVGLCLSNVLFALAHSITPLYALLAGLTGIYLGMAMDFGSDRNLLNPIVIHTVYDFLAFLAVVRTYRSEHGLAF